MSAPVTMMITQAGLDALVDAQAGETEAIRVTAVGLSAASFTMAPTLDALPGEFKRLVAVSGAAVSETIIHMTATDATDDIYELRGLGLYLIDGTLFAVFSQPDPLFRKVSIASFLLALDIAFANGGGNISFGDSTFLLPPATETVKGVAEIADDAETDAGIDDQRIISPKKLKRALDALANALDGEINDVMELIARLTARTITGGSLAEGGGNLSGNVVISVYPANGPEVIQGTRVDRAVTPFSLRALQEHLAIGGTGLVTGGGNLTTSRTVDVRAATGAEAIAGEAADCALTPAGLRAVQVALAIGGTGLVTGGGNLTASRTVDVRAATGAETAAGVATDCAVTPAALVAGLALLGGWNPAIPLFRIPGTPIIVQTGEQRGTTSVEGPVSITFPQAFPNACIYAGPISYISANDALRDMFVQMRERTATGLTVYYQRPDDSDNRIDGFDWMAIGY